MKKPLVFFVCSSFIFASLALCGCEVENIIDESGDSYGIDYITVTVQLRAHYYKYVRDNSTPIIMPDAEIMLKIDKAGGLNKICYFTTDEAGYTSTCEYTLHLYREQPINMYANLQSDPPEEQVRPCVHHH